MESNIRSSFIPQAPIAAPSRGGGGRGGFDMFMLLGLIIFIASAVLAVGVFLYVQYMQASAASKLEQLERAKAAFEPALISELTRLDDRMRAADEVLGNHIAPSALFHLLEQLTLQTVSFATLEFSAQNASEVTLTMQGAAQSVNSVALQADLLSKSGIITNPLFSNINRVLGGVQFDFTSKLNTEALRYRQVLLGGVAAQGATLQEQTQEAPFNILPGGTVPAENQNTPPAGGSPAEEPQL